MAANVNLSPSDKVILILGETGSGKTQFVNLAAKLSNQGFGTGLVDDTKDINLVRIRPSNQRCNIVLVDTPGFNATYRSDEETLKIIENWLRTTQKQKIRLAGVIYLIRISDNRVGKTALAYLHVIRALCEKKGMPDVSVLTTMWDGGDKAAKEKREKELNTLCKEQLGECGFDRFNNSYDSAWKNIDTLLEKQPCPTPPLQQGSDEGSWSDVRKPIERITQDRKESRKLIDKIFFWRKPSKRTKKGKSSNI